MTARDENKDWFNLPLNARTFVPHRDAMLLIDELSESSPVNAEGRAVVKPENPFLDSIGRLESFVLIEFLAQLTAASNGYNSRKSGEGVKAGFLVGFNGFTINRRATLGDHLYLKARKKLEINNVHLVEGYISLAENTLAKGELKLYIADDIPRPAKGGSKSPPDKCTDLIDNALLPSKRSLISRSVMNSLYTLDLSREDKKASGEFCFDSKFPGFSGHFPGYAILPGVVMLEMAKVLCETVILTPLWITNIERAKFVKQVSPGDAVMTEVIMRNSNGTYRIEARLSKKDSVVAYLYFSAKEDIF